ncbi:MAG: 50S ribosomal protein L22 [Bacteroidetes bacterium]|nr:50S ribosomal protein L22 [Bacteroidota bacterium]
MGSKIHNKAEKKKESRKKLYMARLNNCPTSPRKTRLVADLVRGTSVEKALMILKNCEKGPAERLRKLLISAISNWQNKNEGEKLDDAGLFIKEIFVDEGRTLKRIHPAPHGRAHRIRKRSNHVTMILGDLRSAELPENAFESVQEDEKPVKKVTKKAAPAKAAAKKATGAKKEAAAKKTPAKKKTAKKETKDNKKSSDN